MSHEYIGYFLKVKNAFKSYHGDSLTEGSHSVKMVQRSVSDHVPQIPLEVLTFYVR